MRVVPSSSCGWALDRPVRLAVRDDAPLDLRESVRGSAGCGPPGRRARRSVGPEPRRRRRPARIERRLVARGPQALLDGDRRFRQRRRRRAGAGASSRAGSCTPAGSPRARSAPGVPPPRTRACSRACRFRAEAVTEWWSNQRGPEGDGGISVGLSRVRHSWAPRRSRRSTPLQPRLLRRLHPLLLRWLCHLAAPGCAAGDLWGSVGPWFSCDWHT